MARMPFDSSYGLGVQPEVVGVFFPFDVEVDVPIGSFVSLASGVPGRRPVVTAFAVLPVVWHVRLIPQVWIAV